MNSKSNYMEVFIMLKKIKDKVNANWDDIKLFAKAGIEGFFIGSGVGFWFWWLIGKSYCLITHKEMRLIFENKAK